MLRYYTQARFQQRGGEGPTFVPRPPPPPPQPVVPVAPSVPQIQTAFQRSQTLFLTRRLPPALETLHPVVRFTSSCPRSLRIKIWTTYFAILDAVLKLEGPEGKKEFGSLRAWREIKDRVRKGKVWDELLATYPSPGRIEIEIVTACLTLLVTHTQDFVGLQSKIESYLASSQGPAAELRPAQRRAREQLLEMYTLIVLPGVGDWDFARQFVEGNDDLGEVSKAEILDTLDYLQREREEDAEALERLKAEKEQSEEDSEEEERSEAYSTRPSSPTRSVQDDQEAEEVIFGDSEPVHSVEKKVVKASRQRTYPPSPTSATFSADRYFDFDDKVQTSNSQLTRITERFSGMLSLLTGFSSPSPFHKYLRQTIFLLAALYWLSNSMATKATATATGTKKRRDPQATRAFRKAKKLALLSWWWIGGGKGFGYV